MLTVPDLARYMQARIHDIAAYGWAHELLSEVTYLNEQITRLIDTPPGRVFAGTCQGTGRIGPDGTPNSVDSDVEPCGSDLYIREDDRHHLSTVRCGVCGSVYSLATRDEWVRLKYLDELATVADASILLGIPRNTIKSWIRRKKIRRAFTGDDRHVYLVRDIAALDSNRKIGDAA